MRLLRQLFIPKLDSKLSSLLSKYFTFTLTLLTFEMNKNDRISVDRIFQISESARRSPIFVCSNLSKNRRWPIWVVVPFTEWLQMARFPNWRKSENCRLTISNTVRSEARASTPCRTPFALFCLGPIFQFLTKG